MRRGRINKFFDFIHVHLCLYICGLMFLTGGKTGQYSPPTGHRPNKACKKPRKPLEYASLLTLAHILTEHGQSGNTR